MPGKAAVSMGLSVVTEYSVRKATTEASEGGGHSARGPGKAMSVLLLEEEIGSS